MDRDNLGKGRSQEENSKKEKILAEFLEKCQEKFGEDLVSIVLFGSYARGTAQKHSDIDLLVIAKNLPEDWRKRNELAVSLKLSLSPQGTPLSVILISEEDAKGSLALGNPLFYGMLTGYKVLYGSEHFNPLMEKFKEKAKGANLEYIDDKRRWKIKELI